MNTGRGIVRAYDVATGRATVEVIGGHSGWVDMPVATNLSTANLAVGRRCLVVFFDVLNPLDGLVVATYDTVADATAFADQVANRVLAGPTSGANAEPTFRALVADDLPAGISATMLQARSIDAAAPASGNVLAWDAGDAEWTPTAPVVPAKRATMWHDEALVTTGNALTLAVSASQLFCSMAYQNAQANGDVFTNGCVLAAGTYTFSVLGKADTDRGKIDWTLDGASMVAGQDWYAAAAGFNVVKTTASVSVATSGWHKLQGTVNGKHASSSSYRMMLTKYWFTPAAD